MPSVTTSTLGAAERGQVVVGHQHALAAHAVARRQLAPQLGVGHLVLRGGAGPGAGPSASRAGGGSRARSSRAPSRCPARMSSWAAGSARYSRRSQRLERPVGPRQDPRRRALEEVQPPDARLDLRDELDRRRARADHGHALAARSWSWSHVAEWKVVPSKRSRPGRSGIDGSLRAPVPEHERLGGQRALRGLEAPALDVLVPLGVEQLVAEADVRQDPVALARSRAGRPRSPAGARRCASSRGSARRRTSTGARARRRRSRGRCCRATCRRRRRPARGRRSRRCPRLRRRMAMPSPAKPLPTMATRTSC